LARTEDCSDWTRARLLFSVSQSDCAVAIGRLARLGVDQPALVERHGHARDDREVVDCHAFKLCLFAAIGIADDADLRQQLSADDPDVVARRSLAELRRDDIGIVVRRERRRLVAGGRQDGPFGRGGEQPRCNPDEALQDGTHLLKRTLGLDAAGGCRRETRLGLRDVGAGHLADPEAVVRRLELAT
jgi:hypothetical protein